MKKLMVLALMATLLMAGSAFAVNRTSALKPVPNATFQFGAPGVAFGPTTTNNDDSCDIGVAPAATLLLPYFEVDTTNRTTTTLFTVTNVSRFPQIAHVTVWTDWSFPVLDFNIFLTGYDVQPINLLDILTTGTVGSASGTGPTTAQSPLGSLSSGFTNPNFAASINCTNLPGVLPSALVAAVRSALTTGVYNPGSGLGCSFPVGGSHTNAIGYITIDVASNCSVRLPTEAGYFSSDVLFDNVLIGDYEQLGPAANGTVATSFDGAGNAMVHIRAVPEGGFAGTTPGTNLPFTFYDRYTHSTIDRRQPLPSTWAARYIQGGAGAFATNFKIWREGFGSGACAASLATNGILPVSEIVRFDERENPFTFGTGQNCSPCIPGSIQMPETSAQNTTSSNFPTLTGTDVGGWMYLNLNNGGSAAYTVTRNIGGVLTPSSTPGGLAPVGGTTTLGPRPSQNWVIVEMFGSVGANRLSVDFDAAWLGNGCSPAAFLASSTNPIGPAGGVFVCPPPLAPGAGCATTPVGTNTTPLP